VAEAAAAAEEIPPAVAVTLTRAEEPTPPTVIAFFSAAKPITSVRPQPGYRQQIARTRRQDARQLSLF